MWTGRRCPSRHMNTSTCIYQPQWTKAVGWCQVYFGCWKESCLLLWPWPDTVTAHLYLLMFFYVESVRLLHWCAAVDLTADIFTAALTDDSAAACFSNLSACLIASTERYRLFFHWGQVWSVWMEEFVRLPPTFLDTKLPLTSDWLSLWPPVHIPYIYFELFNSSGFAVINQGKIRNPNSSIMWKHRNGILLFLFPQIKGRLTGG